MAKKVSLKGATESGQRPSDRLSYFGRKRKEENSMTEKRKYLVPIKGDVPQGQHCIWLKLHCLNPRLLALTNMGAPLSGKIGICAQEVVLVDISILSSKVLNDLPASSKDVKGPKGKPKCNASTFSANQGLPKPYLIRHGNGVPIVVRPVNDWIYREGGQMNRFGNVGRCADANG